MENYSEFELTDLAISDVIVNGKTLFSFVIFYLPLGFGV